MPLTKQQAESIADALLTGSGGASDAAQSATVKQVPSIYRSDASRRLDPRQQWLAYREVASQPFNRHPVLIGVVFVCLALILLLFWREPHPVAGCVFFLLILAPNVVRTILVRQGLARKSSEAET